MIPYNEEDQRSYYTERCYYITSLVGLEPQTITESNYQLVRDAVMVTFNDVNQRKAVIELGNLLMFSVVFGYGA